MKVQFEVFTKKGRLSETAEGATYGDCLRKVKQLSGFQRIGTAKIVNPTTVKV